VEFAPWAVTFRQGHGREARRTVRVTLGRIARFSLSQARERAREILDRVSKGEPPVPPGAALTVGQLVRRALAAFALSPTTRKEWERLARVEIARALGTRPAAELQRADIRAEDQEPLRQKVLPGRW
jgi:hypothetical protein